ncbi:MAG: bifunctional methylenetetrahydrofolate dehydrogenase/methenyltetrahydrofolate cyclohydrolase FolD [Acidobacteria bacterium]|nr:bifunctional methylenetetrahydrofolate dehydrogenase/methenyltetrahydrofolate cyclohydrolase FolD [Acidobacteriota bacterium]
MPARILDGRKTGSEVRLELLPRIARLRAAKHPPALAVVLVGDDPASAIYVRNKEKACEELGIRSEKLTPPASITTGELLDVVQTLNRRPDIDGILVQMPLPRHVDAGQVLLAIAPEKDVDGFHPCNTGLLVANQPGPRPCTPAGVIELLRRDGIPMAGQEAVIIGRSDIVGKPQAMLLLHEHATVTICHSRTSNLPEVCRRASILVAAIGRPGFVTEEFIQPGATVIDVGINQVTNADLAERLLAHDAARLENFRRTGRATVGDVHPGDAARLAGAYTPVPGGVGPLTIAMLMVNTVAAAERRAGV